MSETTNTETGSNKPPFVAYAVISRGENKKAKWREVGVAFKHKDGKGFDVLLDAMPFDGRITLRVPDQKYHHAHIIHQSLLGVFAQRQKNGFNPGSSRQNRLASG